MDKQFTVEKLKHHEQLEFCLTRPRYRQGRKLTSVKVYTVNEESRYLILSGIPAIKIEIELESLCRRYGNFDVLQRLPDYPQEEFSEAYLLKYSELKSARFAKKQMDGKNYFGDVLHVCYAPELETLQETREKLEDRRKVIAALTRHRLDAAHVSRPAKRQGKVNKNAAERYLSQLRPELKGVYQDKLHANVDDTGVCQDKLHANVDDTGVCQDKLHANVVDTELRNKSLQQCISNGNHTSVEVKMPIDSASQCHLVRNCPSSSSDSLTSSIKNNQSSITVPLPSIKPVMGSQPGTEIPIYASQVDNQGTTHMEKRVLPTSVLVQRKKIKLFGDKKILSYKRQ